MERKVKIFLLTSLELSAYPSPPSPDRMHWLAASHRLFGEDWATAVEIPGCNSITLSWE